MTEQLFNLIKEFQDKTFPTATALSKLHHLKEEVDELIKALEENDPNLRLELADCFLLLIGATRKLGFSFYDMDPIILEKLEIIKLRKWGEPDERGVVKHIKEAEKIPLTGESPVTYDWIKVGDQPAPGDERIEIFSPLYLPGDPQRIRIIDSQFLFICKDATHWRRLAEPKKDIQKVYYCKFCNTNIVDGENGYFSCVECLSKM